MEFLIELTLHKVLTCFLKLHRTLSNFSCKRSRLAIQNYCTKKHLLGPWGLTYINLTLYPAVCVTWLST